MVMISVMESRLHFRVTATSSWLVGDKEYGVMTVAGVTTYQPVAVKYILTCLLRLESYTNTKNWICFSIM